MGETKNELFAPVCSIATTKRKRFFWAVWWTAPPKRAPFRKPDAADGGASTREEAVAAAERAAGVRLALIDPAWARAWMRVLRGQSPWVSNTDGPRDARPRERSPSPNTEESANAPSIWTLLGTSPTPTISELKAAFRKRALELHPDHGGDAATFLRLVRAYEEAQKRIRKPRAKLRR